MTSLVRLSVYGLVALCAAFAGTAQAQSAPVAPASAAKPAVKASNASTSAKATLALKLSSKPAWQDLTPAQQLSLKPLAATWNTLGEVRKRKWLALAANYSNLAPAEQAKLHSRMTEWAALSQQQRAQARLNFAHSKALSPTQKASTWEAYQALSPEEKQKLATAAPAKPAGAAVATKPVAPQKLAVIPETRHSAKKVTKVADAEQAMNLRTLLPKTRSASEPAAKP